VGGDALGACTTASNNTAVGRNALAANTTGTQNVSVGTAALDANTTASYNTAVGYNALGTNTTGDDNVAIGTQALTACTTSDANVAIGASAQPQSTTSEKCVSIGYLAGYQITTGDNNICIGTDAGRTGSPGGAVQTASNQLCLGDENITHSFVQVDWTISSDQRDKTDFADLDIGLDFVKALEPGTYKWDKRSKYIGKDDPSADLDTVTHDGTHKEDWLDVGFKAQAVEALEKAAGYTLSDKTKLVTSLTENGKQYGLQYSKFVPILVKAVQELSTEVEALKAQPKCKCQGD